jgi:pimeloyl-ACP methyl ester carboxylesterase
MTKKFISAASVIVFLLAMALINVQAQRTASPEVQNIVLVHGAWADGSSWGTVIPLLQERGYNVTAVQIPLTSLADDAAVTSRVLAMQNGSTLLVGHSYGGVVITAAGANASNVVGLVYISAFAPDEGEVLGELNGRMPAAPGQANLRPDAYGFLWIDPKAFPESFAQDVDPVQAQVMAAVQKPLSASIFGDKVSKAAWKTKPSWYLVSENDRIINPDLERFMAQRIGARKVVSIPSDHASLVSHPNEVAQLITDAANATAMDTANATATV